jgi:TIR domain
MNIFVSYTSRNNEVSKQTLISLAEKLTSFADVFIDLIHNISFDRQARVKQELESADILILLKSQSTLSSEWVKFELERAADNGIPIVEFSVEELEKLTDFQIKDRVLRQM